MKYYFIQFLIVCLFPPYAWSGESVINMRVSVDPVEQSFPLNAKLIAKLSIENRTDSAVKFYFNSNVPEGLRIEFPSNEDGIVLVKPPFQPSIEEPLLTIEMKSSYTVNIDLGRLVKVKKPGSYKVKYHFALPYYRAQDAVTPENARSFDETGEFTLTCRPNS